VERVELVAAVVAEVVILAALQLHFKVTSAVLAAILLEHLQQVVAVAGRVRVV
jgi:hypothetical protein